MMSVMSGGNNALRNLLYSRWVSQAFIILVVLGGSLALALKPSMMILLGVAGIACLPLIIKLPEVCLIATLFAGFVIPYYGPSGLNITMIGVAGLLALWFSQTIMNRQRITWVNYPFMRPMFGLILVSTLAFLIGQLPWFRLAPAPLGAQIASLFLFILSIGAFFYAAFRFGKIGWLKLLVFAFILYAPLKVIEKVEPSFFSISQWLFQYGSDGSQFWLWMVVLIFGQAFFNWRISLSFFKSPFFELVVHLFLVALVGSIVYVMVIEMRDWKSGWIPTIAGLGATLFFWRPRLGLFVGAIIGVVSAGTFSQSLIESDEYSYSTRLDAWSILLDMVKVNPVTGLGPANYYNYTPLFKIRGYDVAFNSHSQYVDMMLQTGILGLICFLWIGVAIGWYGWGVLKRTPKGGFAYAYMLSAMGGLVGMYVSAAFGDWILPFFYNVSMNGFRSSVLGWIFLGGMVAVDRLVAQPYQASLAHQNAFQDVQYGDGQYGDGQPGYSYAAGDAPYPAGDFSDLRDNPMPADANLPLGGRSAQAWYP